jgi:hypothetical protein
MGVFSPSSSRLMKSPQPGKPGRGLRGSSEGSVVPVDTGVLRRGSVGLTMVLGEAEGMVGVGEERGREDHRGRERA